MRKRVIVGLSGGVDSSVAAALLKQQEYEVIGVTMRIWDGSYKFSSKRNACFGPDEEDAKDARRVAEMLEIQFYEIDLSKEYKKVVLDYFRREYLSGRTPNPCVVCNSQIKFGILLEKIQSLGVDFDFFATGHYARVEFDPKSKRYLLKKAIDRERDQSYFLYRLTQKQLSKTLFPLGELTKQKVREIALSLGLPVSRKRDSQDFFRGDISELVNAEEKPGKIVDTSGKVLGMHRGFWRFTIGQRRGLSVSVGKPLYVVDLIPETNTVVVGEEDAIYRREMIVSNLNWISIEDLEKPMEVEVKIRHGHSPAKAVIFPAGFGKVRVVFEFPQRAITPGQSAVFYSGDVVVGGGVIESVKM